MSERIYIWSVPIKPLRRVSVPLKVQAGVIKILPWMEKFFLKPVHTFATIGSDWLEPPIENLKEGYWYCAGDFCSTEDKKVFGLEVDDSDVEFARCLVTPDIQKEDEEEHNLKVISGIYPIDFVCHNISNRVLYASKDIVTLANMGLPLTAYKAIINTPLGVYGRHTREWLLTINNCCTIKSDFKEPKKPIRTKEEELDLIHLRAAGGDKGKANNISSALENIDAYYARRSELLYKNYDSGLIGILVLNAEMENLLRTTLYQTEKKLGKDLTKKIYGDYSLDLESPSEMEDSNEEEETFVEEAQEIFFEQ